MCVVGAFMMETINRNTRRRPFIMTIGLVEKSGDRRTRGMEVVQWIISQWMLKQKKTGKPYIPGQCDYNTTIYVDGSKAAIEPTAVFKGDLDPIDNRTLSDKDAVKALTELAELLANELKQDVIHLVYGEENFVLKRKP